jgi:hypothetical protein
MSSLFLRLSAMILVLPMRPIVSADGEQTAVIARMKRPKCYDEPIGTSQEGT